MRRLSKSISEMKLHYDAVVIGSGYGGGVAASRLARCGRNVCLLERGKEFDIGDFPDRFLEAQQELQISKGSMHIGSPLGLFDVRLGDDMNVLVGCGLGGTSLINANVAIEPDLRLWEEPVWPEDIKNSPSLKEGYQRAQRMLRPRPYPNKTPLAKLKALETSAKALGAECIRPPINVTFQDEVNWAGVHQPACTLCGDCCSGCNVGSKNTIQVTYLPDAVNHGAEIYTETNVRSISKERGKWRIYFEFTGKEREKFGAPDQSIVADIVILAAGTLGSTEILLRSKENGLSVSSQLGKKFSGNGDILAFGYNNDAPVNGIGVGHPPREDVAPVGPCITGLIDLRKTASLKDGMIVEEGTIPSALAPVLPVLMSGGSAIFGEDMDFGFRDAAKEKARSLQSFWLGAYRGAVQNTQTYLVMAHDDGAGHMRLENDKLKLDWPQVARQSVFDRIEDVLKKATAATGGTYIKNPLSKTILGENLITVHPLGGCSIGKTRQDGVVNHKCQVFDNSPHATDEAVHRGLYVCDGSIMPTPLGVNPLLTITAVSERAMIHLADDYGWHFDDSPKADSPVQYAGRSPSGISDPAGIQFTERMAGFISASHLEDFKAAEEQGKREGNAFAFTATILIEDIESFAKDKDHTGKIIGSVECTGLSPAPLDISNGVFNLMKVDQGSAETRRFEYKMVLGARDGTEYYFEGHKIVHADTGFDLWEDTTQLFVTIYSGHTANSNPVAKGILHISLDDFANQLRTIKGTNGKTPEDRMSAVVRFGRLFAGSLFEVYGGVFVPPDRYDQFAPRKKRALRTALPSVHYFETQDHKKLRLIRYKGGEKGPVMLTHGLGVSSQIFSIDTIETNLVEFLYAAGYDCWLLDYRASTDLPYSRERWNADHVAILDYPAAVTKIRQETGKSSIQVVAHCFGSTTFFMAMLAGLKGVRSAVSSQIATDVLVPWWPQRFLAHLRLPSLLSLFGIDAVNARASRYDRFYMKILDRLIKLILPVQREDRTRNATSNRITALYGQLYELDQLNTTTLRSGLPEMFGYANIEAFQHLATIARKRIIVDHKGENSYLPKIDRLALPICFIHGAENACFKLESTQRTLDRLSDANGPNYYERHEIQTYGHIDCIFGKDAVTDVYPIILRHLEKTALKP